MNWQGIACCAINRTQNAILIKLERTFKSSDFLIFRPSLLKKQNNHHHQIENSNIYFENLISCENTDDIDKLTTIIHEASYPTLDVNRSGESRS